MVWDLEDLHESKWLQAIAWFELEEELFQGAPLIPQLS